MSTPQEPETPDPVEAAAITLDREIRAVIDAISGAAKDLAARSRKLGEKGRGANGLKAATEVWSRGFEKLAQDVADEGPKVSKSLLGKGVIEITTHTNPDLAAAAASDPERKK